MMTSSQVVEMSVTTSDDSPSQDHTHQDTITCYPGFKPFTVKRHSLLINGCKNN